MVQPLHSRHAAEVAVCPGSPVVPVRPIHSHHMCQADMTHSLNKVMRMAVVRTLQQCVAVAARLTLRREAVAQHRREFAAEKISTQVPPVAAGVNLTLLLE